jgi:hypothetical protein
VSSYEKCKIFRTTEWVIWDPNKKMLHLFDDGHGALEFFNEGMPVTGNCYEGTVEGGA